MYEKFFGLKQAPFSIAPDPHYLFMSERHREALAHLLYGLGGGGGFVLLTGEIGAGKTTVCRCFLEQIPAHCSVAYIFNPKLTVVELLKTVCDEFGIEAPAEASPAASVKDYVDRLNAFLLQAHAAGRNSVLVIDEAQNLSADVLEQLRLLTNLETHERKLLQIVLIGQPELRTMLASPSLEQLAQRVVARFHLEALSLAETEQYVAHRLAVAGLATALPFDRRALAQIHRRTRGVPRRINLLCDRALLGAYARGSTRVDRALIDQAAREVFGPPVATRGVHRHRWAWGLGLAATAAAAGGVLVLGEGPLRRALGPVVAAIGPSPAASPPAAAAAASAAAAFDMAGLLASLPQDEKAAWRLLAPAWALPADAAQPCTAWAQQQVQCFRGTANLAQVRLLDRPGLLTLADGRGTTAYALLTGLTADRAELRVGDAVTAVPLGALAEAWTGEFSTLWRVPPAEGGAAAQAAALAHRLDAAQGPARASDATLRERVQTFQRAQGLRADGVAGPMTIMQLNRATGVEEPRLARGK
ncbi:AAA family ATPase [Aquincola sp. MAHUQ-54]|uniref:AAA family ATPase n=1 Tax=Aquincola agrisoli TaxID=3119538 RepID=A0AAW9Q3Q4_9BURK